MRYADRSVVGVDVGLLRHARGPELLLQLQILRLVPQSATAFALTLLGVGMLGLIGLQELGDLGGVVDGNVRLRKRNDNDTKCTSGWPLSRRYNRFTRTVPILMSDEPSTPSPSADPKTSARMIPFIVGCALFMQMLDATVVATALPAMAQALGTSAVRLNVAITSYLLAVAVFVPVSGWAADRFGARRVFVAAIALFALSSVACAMSSSVTQLVIARIVQGIAGAMMVPVGRIILLRVVPKEDLLRAMAFLSMPALLGPVIGPPQGGFLVTYASWHWIFLINVPIGILGIALVMRYIVEIKDADAPRLDLP